jgi:hypothetical protein
VSVVPGRLEGEAAGVAVSGDSSVLRMLAGSTNRRGRPVRCPVGALAARAQLR